MPWSPLTISTPVSPTVCISPSIIACRSGSAATSPLLTSAAIALARASLSPNARSFTTSAGSARAAAEASVTARPTSHRIHVPQDVIAFTASGKRS